MEKQVEKIRNSNYNVTADKNKRDGGKLVMRHNNWSFIVMVILAGGFCLVKGIFDRMGAVRLQGTISSFMQNNYGVYFPIVTFTYQGQEFSMRTANGSKKPKGQVGDTVEVLYSQKNQKYVHLTGSNYDFVFSITLLVAGLVILVYEIMR